MRRVALALAIALLGLVAGAAAAQQDNLLQARLLFREANSLFQQRNYPAAAAKYEQVIELDPNFTYAYFFLANSYDNQYQHARRGDPANDALLTKAEALYRTAAAIEADPKIKRLALDYLVNVYGPDKLNNASKALPIMLDFIRTDPKDTSSYFGLANIYEQRGDYQRAEKMLQDARDARPDDSAVYMQLAGFYFRQGDFAKTMGALEARAKAMPRDAEAHYTIATYYWEKAYRDSSTPQADKIRYVRRGLAAVDEALKLNPDYFEALTFKSLLLRVEASLEENPARARELLIEANLWRDRAFTVREMQKAKDAVSR